MDSLIKLMDRGIDLEDGNLLKIAESLEDIRGDRSFSLKRFLKLERDLTYKEAEEISKEIYGQKMGKDVYDAIISLKNEKVDITKENIDRTIEIMSKIHKLKNVEDTTLIEVLKEDLVFNINNLYKITNSYELGRLSQNIEAKTFEAFSILEDTNINKLKGLLKSLDIEESLESISILREFIVNDMAMDRPAFDRVLGMKKAIKDLIQALDTKTIVRLDSDEVDILEENIYDLLEEIKKEPTRQEEAKDNIDSIRENLDMLGRISEKDLVSLIKTNEDFNLKNIKEIFDLNQNRGLSLPEKTGEKVVHISNIFNSLGENLNSKLLSFTMERHTNISLENLYNVNKEMDRLGDNIRPVEPAFETRIFEEYVRARNSLTANMVKDSIKENKVLENMDLGDLNNFINKKANKYKDNERLLRDLKDLKEADERVLPLIMKNDLPMTIKKIRQVNEVLKDFTKINDQETNPTNDQILNLLNEGQGSFDQGRQEERTFSLEEVTPNDYVFSTTINLDGQEKKINIFIPHTNETIDRDNMTFIIDLETDKLGPINLSISILGGQVTIGVKDQEINKYLSFLEEDIRNLGYGVKQVVS